MLFNQKLPRSHKIAEPAQPHRSRNRILKVFLTVVGSVCSAILALIPTRAAPPVDNTPPPRPLNPAAVRVLSNDHILSDAKAGVMELLQTIYQNLSAHADNSDVEFELEKLLTQSINGMKVVLNSIEDEVIPLIAEDVKDSFVTLVQQQRSFLDTMAGQFSELSQTDLHKQMEDLIGAIEELITKLEQEQPDINPNQEHVAAGRPPEDEPV